MKKRWFRKKSNIILLIIILAIFLIIVSYEKNCKNNVDCFNKKVSKCFIPSKVVVEKEGNILEYRSKWSFEKDCRIDVKMVKVGSGFRKELAKEVEGKSMKCIVSKKILKSTEFSEINDLLDYCSGSLKEGIYNVIIKNMYTIVLQNMNELVDEIDKVSKSII